MDYEKKYSKDLAAVKLVDYNKYTPVNINLSKAFDTLKFGIILHELHYYRVTGVPFELIR